MAEHELSSSKHKHKRFHNDHDHKSKKRYKGDRGSSKHSRKEDHHLRITDEDPDEEDVWVERNIDLDGEKILANGIPTAETLKLKTDVVASNFSLDLPSTTKTETSLKRDEWMLIPPEVASTSRIVNQLQAGEESLSETYGNLPSDAVSGGGIDFFSSLGIERKKPSRPDVQNTDQPRVSSKELNKDIIEGQITDFTMPMPSPKAVTPGGPGSQWRMMRLRRVYETAEEEGRSVEEVALDRFGTLQAFEEAKGERRFLDERKGRCTEKSQNRISHRREEIKDSKGVEKRMMFTDITGSGGSSRSSSFRRPGARDSSIHSTPTPTSKWRPADRRLDNLRQATSQVGTPQAQSHTPIPSVMTPQIATVSSKRALSPSSLNKLQAKVLRARLMNAPEADELEHEYEEESRTASGEVGDGNVRTTIEVLPTLDARGRLYDVGHGKDDAKLPSGNRKRTEKFDTRDPKTGDLLRYNADDDTTTLGEMLRQEKFGAGQADQKNLDAQFAKAIMGDGKFEDNMDYLDDNAERLGRQKMRSDAMKRQFAIHDYKRTQQALATCPFCFGEDDSPPKAPTIAMGTRAYLSCTLHEELLEGHCLIVPIQHHMTMLEGDDDVWDEVRNFMKSLMRMFAEEGKGVIFFETVTTFKWQKHTYIECVPLPWAQFDDIPAYFKESILQSEAEWSQHKKLIDFSARPGGFRRAMVPNLPYFMVQFDHKGEKGYGHVVEGTEESTAADEEDGALDEGEKGGGEFPRYFAGEIIGNVLDLEPRKWRRPRRIDFRLNKDRVAKFYKNYIKFDWTGLIGK